MFCTKCGHKNPDNYKFCSRCGNPLKQTVIVEEDITTETKQNEVKFNGLTEAQSETLGSQDLIKEESSSTKISAIEDNPKSPLNQYDEDGNLILPVYDEPKKGKKGLIIGLILAACLTGFGIWGYSAYVESAKKEADLAVWNAWEEYLTATTAGQILSALGENIENTNHDYFSESKFKQYIKDNIEPSPDINWGEMVPLVKNIKIYVPPLKEITPLMTENLRSLYAKMDDSDYRANGGWDPIADMKETNNITIKDIIVSDDGHTGKVKYHTSLEVIEGSPKTIYMMKNERGIWEISDFQQEEVYFSSMVQSFFDEKERNRVVSYEGQVYTSSGSFPLTLEVSYGSLPLTALYHNVQYNVSLELTGYESDGYLYLSCDNAGETVAFKLESKSNEVLIGEFIVTPEDGEEKSYDVVLNSINNQ